MARVPYVNPTDLPDDRRDELESAFREGETRDLYRALGNSPPLLGALRSFLATAWRTADIDARRRELVILAVARAVDAPYEWHQHVPVALDAGLSEAEIRAVSDGEYDAFTPAEGALLRYAAAVARDEVDDATYGAFAAHADEATAVAVTLLASAYVMVARFLSALDVETEAAFVGWDLERA